MDVQHAEENASDAVSDYAGRQNPATTNAGAFCQACADGNTAEQLLEVLSADIDDLEAATWEITADEYKQAVRLAFDWCFWSELQEIRA